MALSDTQLNAAARALERMTGTPASQFRRVLRSERSAERRRDAEEAKRPAGTRPVSETFGPSPTPSGFSPKPFAPPPVPPGGVGQPQAPVQEQEFVVMVAGTLEKGKIPYRRTGSFP